LGLVGTTGTDGGPVVLGTEGTETGNDGDAPMPGTEVSETGKDGEAPPVGTEPGRLIRNVEIPETGIGSNTRRLSAEAEAVAATQAIGSKLEGRMEAGRWLRTW